MVNKAALLVLGVIVLVSMGVGVLIGMQIGNPSALGAADGNQSGGPSGTDDDPGGTPDRGDTPTVQAPDTPAPDERTTILPRRFSAPIIAGEIEKRINDHRASEGLDTLSTSGRTVDLLRRIATNHSDGMADQGYVSHRAKNTNSRERYERVGLFSQCKFESNSGSYIVDATGNNLEVIEQTTAGRYGDETNEGQFNEDEAAVAEAIVQQWIQSYTYHDRLLYQSADQVGAGVEVTRDGTVYATANFC